VEVFVRLKEKCKSSDPSPRLGQTVNLLLDKIGALDSMPTLKSLLTSIGRIHELRNAVAHRSFAFSLKHTLIGLEDSIRSIPTSTLTADHIKILQNLKGATGEQLKQLYQFSAQAGVALGLRPDVTESSYIDSKESFIVYQTQATGEHWTSITSRSPSISLESLTVILNGLESLFLSGLVAVMDDVGRRMESGAVYQVLCDGCANQNWLLGSDTRSNCWYCEEEVTRKV
jgi:hypothetical protein